MGDSPIAFNAFPAPDTRAAIFSFHSAPIYVNLTTAYTLLCSVSDHCFPMIEKNFRSLAKTILLPMAKALTAIGVTANMITIFGLFVNAIAAFFLATGRLIVGGILILFGGSFDAMDGVVARFSGKNDVNASGALLDSVIDRYSEAIIFLGTLIYFYHLSHQPSHRLIGLLGVILVFASVVGSILVSYVRARAEGLQIDCKVGLMQRPERIALLALGVLAQGIIIKWFSPTPPFGYNGIVLVIVCGFLAVTSNFTALHRLVFSFSQLNNR